MVYGQLAKQYIQENNIITEAESLELALNERAVFNSLTESIEILDIIQENKFTEGLKSIGKKIIAALKWLKDKIKEIVQKIKEKFKSKKSKEMEAKVKELEKALADSNINTNNIESEKAKLEREVEELKSKLAKETEDKKDFHDVARDLSKDNKELKSENSELRAQLKQAQEKLNELDGLSKLAKNPIAGFRPYGYITNIMGSRTGISSAIADLKGITKNVYTYISKDQNAQKALQKEVMASIDDIKEKFGQNLEKLFVFDTKKFGINKVDSATHDDIDRYITNFADLAGPNGVTIYIKEDLEKIPEADRTKDIAKRYSDCRDVAWQIASYGDLTVNQISELESIVNSLFNNISSYKIDSDRTKNIRTELRTAKDLNSDVIKDNDSSRKEILYSPAPIIKDAMANYKRIINVLKINLSVTGIISQYCKNYCGLIEGAAKSITYEYNSKTYSGKYNIEM